MAMSLQRRVTHAVRWFLLHRLPTCQQTVRVMSDSLERPLSLRERVLLKLHLWVCVWCVWYLEELRLLRNSLRMEAAQIINDESPAPSLSPEARERIQRALSSQE
jgi:hypothetical protein